MNYLFCVFILLLPLTLSYPRHYSTDLNDFLNLYMRQPERNSVQTNEELGARRQHIFRLMPLHYGQQSVQQQARCLPQIWTCGPGLPPCCHGLMCYDGNAKRGRHCVARG